MFSQPGPLANAVASNGRPSANAATRKPVLGDAADGLEGRCSPAAGGRFHQSACIRLAAVVERSRLTAKQDGVCHVDGAAALGVGEQGPGK